MKAGHDSQLILYCKRGWFKRGETFAEQVEDLKKIIAEVYLIPEDCICLGDIRSNLVDIVFKYQELHNYSLVTFIDEISPEKFYQCVDDRSSGYKYMGRPHPDYNFDQAVIRRCIGIISTLHVRSGDRRLLYLEMPNFGILPPYDAKTVAKVTEMENNGEWE